MEAVEAPHMPFSARIGNRLNICFYIVEVHKYHRVIIHIKIETGLQTGKSF
jgi:hypothetical protein